MENEHIELYTDGSSLNNPGPSGYGFVIRYWGIDDNTNQPIIKKYEGSKGFKLSTNNRMELMGGIYGVNHIISGIPSSIFKDVKQISLTSDSKYLCDAINNGWISKWAQNGWITSTQKMVKNKDLWQEVIKFQSTLRDMNITLVVNHILGHNGHEFNERADALATAASRDASNHIIDQLYENIMNNNNNWRK